MTLSSVGGLAAAAAMAVSIKWRSAVATTMERPYPLLPSAVMDASGMLLRGAPSIVHTTLRTLSARTFYAASSPFPSSTSYTHTHTGVGAPLAVCARCSLERRGAMLRDAMHQLTQRCWGGVEVCIYKGPCGRAILQESARTLLRVGV